MANEAVPNTDNVERNTVAPVTPNPPWVTTIPPVTPKPPDWIITLSLNKVLPVTPSPPYKSKLPLTPRPDMLDAPPTFIAEAKLADPITFKVELRIVFVETLNELFKTVAPVTPNPPWVITTPPVTPSPPA